MTRVTVIPALPDSPHSSDVLARRSHPSLECEITTLAAWCQVKQQQRKPLPSSVEDCEEDVEESIDGCTNLLTPLSLDSDAEIKKVFLDRLAELLCYRKDPSLVTSTAMIYTEQGGTIVAARNSSSRRETWSSKDVEMLEYLARVLEKISSDEILDFDPLPALQNILVEYYEQRIRHHAKEIISIEKGKTELEFFKQGGCGGFISGHLAVHDFAKYVEYLSYNTDFYTELKANLTLKELRRVVEELAYVRRPIQGAGAFLHVAQQCSGFRNTKVLLLNSLPPRKVKASRLPEREFSGKPQLESKFHTEVKKRKNIHAEMMLMTYLGSRGPNPEVFPYLGVSKRTCLLCGHILREMGQFETRGNHGKVYSQWTLPPTIWANLETEPRLRMALQCLRNVLRDEESKIELSHRDAEKESEPAAPIPPRYENKMTLFNSVVEDPRFLEREAEWLAVSRKRDREARIAPRNDKGFVNIDATRDSASTPITDTEGPGSENVESATLVACAFCKNTCELTYTCKKCETAAYCNLKCFRFDWHRHKFCCTLGRSIDVTDYLVLSCHTNEFPQEDDVTKKYGFMSFASGTDRWRLFRLYRRLVIEWGIDEEELRSAVEQNRLKEMLTFRCSQTRDPLMLSDMQWLESEKRFGANGEGSGLIVHLNKAREELLSPNERKAPIVELQPPEKRNALVFYAQIRNGFKPDVDEDNWIALGFCTATDPASEERLARAYGSLVEQCPFDEFWNSMAESRIVELFKKYGLAERIFQMRNFVDFMLIVRKWHQSVWELKRFTWMNVAHPFRAVVVDYGFMNCEDPRQRMQLRGIYHEYFRRGEDEMKLHKACVTGKLAAFLKSVLGSLTVNPELLSNPYPLENYPLMGMVTESTIMCPQSALNQVSALEGRNGKGIITTVPDTEDKAMVRQLHVRAAFLGTGLRQRYYSGSDGTLIEEFAF